MARRKNVEWREVDRVVEHDAHGTKANVLRRFVFKQDGQDYVGKVDPKLKDLDSVIHVSKQSSIFTPSIVASNANLEKDQMELRERLELARTRRRTRKKPKGKDEKDDDIDLGPGVEVTDFTKK